MIARRQTRIVLVGFLVVIAAIATASTALADVRIARAELSGTRLRVDGTAFPNRTITINGVAMGTSDSAGSFRIERDPFAKPADCTVSVNDGSANPTTATLSGCTVSSSPPPPSSSAALSRETMNPTDVVGGDSATGTVFLTAAAPAGGFVVALSSDNTAAANVQPSVTVPAGSTSASFVVTTNAVQNSQSALILATAGNTTVYAIITAWTPFAYANGSISILPGGGGSGQVTSQPAGINCTITNGNGSGGTCSAFFPVGTVVSLTARPAADSSFVGWRPTPGCTDASKVTVSRGTNITCQVGFVLK